MSTADSDEAIINGAQRRATISGFLGQHPGPHKIAAIAQGTNINRETCGQVLAEMAKEGLVGYRKQGTSKLFWEQGSVTMGEDTRRGAKGRAVANGRRKGAKDVELVINGTLVVLGRNPATGRLRITLEEV